MHLVAALEREAKMADEQGARKTRNYRLYADTMQRLVEIAAYREVSVTELVDPVLSALADAEYMAMLNEKMAAEKERQRLLAENQKKKKGTG